MPIQFPQLLQDSWNFMRNQRAFSLWAMLCFALLQALTLMFSPKIDLNAPEQLVSIEAFLIPTLLSGLANIFLTVLLILNIKAINQGSFHHFFQPLEQSLNLLFPVILLSILMVLPLSVGLAFLTIQAGNLTLVALPLLITGLYLFIKLSLLIYAYLIEDRKTIGETVRFTWALSRGRMLPLILFCVLAYFVPQLLVGIISGISQNLGSANLIISVLLGAFLTVYTLVFSFRFYQVYRQGAK